MEKHETDVVLVSMPFASYRQPSLALGILKAVLKKQGIDCKVFYFTLDLVDMIGEWIYDKIATWHLPDLMGDWMFAEYLFGNGIPEAKRYAEDILAGGLPEHRIPNFGKEDISGFIWDEILKIRNQIPDFLSQCVDKILRAKPKVVGITSGVHQQASTLALAKAIKEKEPDIYIVIGGPNVRGPMGLEAIKSFPYVDVVVSGEGEEVFPEIVKQVLQGKEVKEMPGVFISKKTMDTSDILSLYKSHGDDVLYAPKTSNLDEIPYPDYSDFIEQWDKSSVARQRGRLLIEGSRGCFWGEKVRCIFCGQASPTLVYRDKSAVRFANELEDVYREKPEFQICITDEAVSTTVIEEMARVFERKEEIPEIVYVQVRPDLKKEDLKRLFEIGVRRLEVGIESFSTRILRLMRKGTRGIRNIAFLKWCKELKIEVVWNLLWGFPQEPPDIYDNMAALVPLLFHLDPPNFVGEVRLERFSPMFDEPEFFGIKEIKPFPAYFYVYDLPEESVHNLAYYFTGKYDTKEQIPDYTAKLVDMITLWKQNKGRARLDVYEKGEELVILDGRSPFILPKKIILKGLQRDIYLLLDDVRTEDEIFEKLDAKSCQLLQQDIKEELIKMVQMGLVIKEGDSYLGLGIRESK